MATITAVIITFNEERNILRCIDSVIPVSDEVIIIDSFSTDSTQQLVESRGLHVTSKRWNGYSDAKNYGNSLASGEFILSIDADEELSETLQQEILSIKVKPNKDAYEMNRITNFCGKWIKHSGWYPDLCVRLFRREKITWVGSVHESLEGYNKASVGRLKGHLFHYSYPTIKSFVYKVSQYAALAAEKDVAKRKRYFLVWHGILKPFARFFIMYVIRLGFLDGRAGFTIAIFSAFERFLRYTNYLEIQRSNTQRTK